MPSRVWSHICDYASIDANGKASMIGEFDRIFAPTVPVGHPFFFVISKWNGIANESFTHRVRITSPNREVIAESAESTITIRDIGNGEGNHITIDTFLMIGFPKFGEYAVEIILNKLPVQILPLTIMQIQQSLPNP